MAIQTGVYIIVFDQVKQHMLAYLTSHKPGAKTLLLGAIHMNLFEVMSEKWIEMMVDSIHVMSAKINIKATVNVVRKDAH